MTNFDRSDYDDEEFDKNEYDRTVIDNMSYSDHLDILMDGELIMHLTTQLGRFSKESLIAAVKSGDDDAVIGDAIRRAATDMDNQ